MPGGSNYMEDWVEQAVLEGTLPESAVDACAARVIALALKGESRPKGKSFNEQAHHALARTIAENGAVLLKNEGDILPVAKSDIALIGEMARTMRYQGAGSQPHQSHQTDYSVRCIARCALHCRMRRARCCDGGKLGSGGNLWLAQLGWQWFARVCRMLMNPRALIGRA